MNAARKRLPLILRLALRCVALVLGWFAVGIAMSLAQHFLGPLHLDWATKDQIISYQGGLNMLLILWFCGLLRRDSDTRRMAETGTGSVRSTGSAGPQGIAQPPAGPSS